MPANPDVVRGEFDRIAGALEATNPPDVLQPYERAVLGWLPPALGDVLEIGCGHGAFTRHLAHRARSVLALDLSPEMIRVARARSTRQPDIEYRVADVTAVDLPAGAFDAVVSLATVHHLPLAPTILRAAGAARPGGWLIVQDLVTRPGIRYAGVNALACLARGLRTMRRARAGVRHRTVAALYREHGRDERYLEPDEVARVYARLLPGARIVHHLEWRYTALWQRAAGSPPGA